MKSISLLLNLAAVAAATQGSWSAPQKPLVAHEATSGVATMPLIGFGTWNLSPDHENATKAVEAAIVEGYRHIDCAAAYSNEKAVGEGIARGLKAANLSREDIWVTSKLWNTGHDPLGVAAAALQTVSDLGVGYLDLYLMHWPVAQSPSGENTISYINTWLAMSKLVQLGQTRHIGVSNFSPEQMRDLIANGGGLRPHTHQMEMHPYLPQSEWRLWHASQGIYVTAYSPLGNMNPTYDGGKDAPTPLLSNDRVKKIAKRAGCTPAQAVLKWGMSRGVSVIPKSKHVQYIRENLGAEQCDLSYEDFTDFDEIGDHAVRFNNPSKAWGVDLYQGLQGV